MTFVASTHVLILGFLMHRVTSTSHSKFVDDVKGYRSACKSIGWESKQGNGYGPSTGIFTAPEDGVYSFAWAFLSSTGGSVYIAAVVDNQIQANTWINEQKTTTHINTSGHLIYKLKKMNKVWIRTWWQAATYMHADNFLYFSGYKISFS